MSFIGSLAVQISAAKHGAEFIDLFSTLRKRRMTARWGSFQAMYRQHTRDGKRVLAELDQSDKKIFALVEKVESVSRTPPLSIQTTARSMANRTPRQGARLC